MFSGNCLCTIQFLWLILQPSSILLNLSDCGTLLNHYRLHRQGSWFGHVTENYVGVLQSSRGCHLPSLVVQQLFQGFELFLKAEKNGVCDIRWWGLHRELGWRSCYSGCTAVPCCWETLGKPGAALIAFQSLILFCLLIGVIPGTFGECNKTLEASELSTPFSILEILPKEEDWCFMVSGGLNRCGRRFGP